MNIEDDLVEKTPKRKNPEYRPIFDSDIKKMMLEVKIFNQENKPYDTFEEFNKKFDKLRAEYNDDKIKSLYEDAKKSYEFRTGQRYIFFALYSTSSLGLTIQRMYEDEFETIKEKYLISNSSTSVIPNFILNVKLKD